MNQKRVQEAKNKLAAMNAQSRAIVHSHWDYSASITYMPEASRFGLFADDRAHREVPVAHAAD